MGRGTGEDGELALVETIGCNVNPPAAKRHRDSNLTRSPRAGEANAHTAKVPQMLHGRLDPTFTSLSNESRITRHVSSPESSHQWPDTSGPTPVAPNQWPDVSILPSTCSPRSRKSAIQPISIDNPCPVPTKERELYGRDKSLHRTTQA